MLDQARLAELLDRFPRLSIGLVGDLFLDRYLEIDPRLAEISLETGLEAHQVTALRNSPGALGTVLSNLAALGVGRLTPVTVLGDDGHAYDLRKALAGMPVDDAHVLSDANRLTPTYTKPMKTRAGAPAEELSRLDVRTRAPLGGDTLARVLTSLEAVWQATDGLIVLDQVPEADCGVVSSAVRRRLAELARERPERLMFVDSRRQIRAFEAGVLKPNRSECLAAAGLDDGASDARLAAAVDVLSARTAAPVYCTLGERGIWVAVPGEPGRLAPAVPVSGPIDIVGAGDSATAGIVSSRLAGATWFEAAQVGNLVASITIQQIGTTGTATPAQVLRRGAATAG